MPFDPKVHVGVSALLTRTTEAGEEILIMKRGANATHGENTWALPGGWIDWGQSPEEAAARELMEEVNIIASASDGVVTGAVANTYGHEDMHVICVNVRFRSHDASAMANMEPAKCDELRWVQPSELAGMTLFPPFQLLAQSEGWLK